ncbi:MAG: type I 3-dehydroquinate dehydratase [Rhodoferax sp.]|nr:type I 3-dehydroquinate dehydratase [Rhodoferax sp.]OIP20764.1 MAG: 3-dehydroquinate dehydratase [Comamonadaceae bacterium CG2_30_60_41]PIW06929.1 MAG: type I 3-dehydroquinate dehydratase [Comamonadaceae bacterium CG17_big_fil_post_rev_8_21_14_2_50_60_13]PIY24600.1 MAG: type I 3-dehydroquinate dehydratase [Comamonadaceae bacterium CG_4_10_14_3_um_filter_60_75]PJC19250.1 MAG: type I 3-dehydroquinate dehydratase [Comamonadaceae bacterium CG_4_9_14_0_8_um_filter_60_18]
MNNPQPITLNGQPIAGDKSPLICTPLVGRTREDILAELTVVIPKRPDVLEWRVDFFKQIGDTAAVIAAASAIKKEANGVPLLFTRRSIIEGGEVITLTEAQVIALYQAVCASGCVDLIDYEMANDMAHIGQIRDAAKTNGVQLVLSFHNFSCTPEPGAIAAKFLQAEQLGADVAKVAVMPKDLDDVLTLLAATRSASKTLRIPLISMAMGPLGAVTRLVGGVFGSSLTFAVGASSSAPGQIPIEDIRLVLTVLQQSMQGR